MNILVTGAAGFIGFHLCKALVSYKKIQLIGIDNLSPYYDVTLKKDRLKILKSLSKKNFKFIKCDISNKNSLNKIIENNQIKIIYNLAAQAGVRESIKDTSNYFATNILGFYNILEACKKYKIKHLIFASTSSVYGDNKKFPLKEENETNKPLSFYAASKKTNEVLAYSYSHIHKLHITGLRFFTVYGEYGRPDMAIYKFIDGINKNKKINLYNYGNHYRDFTYIDDVINSLVKLKTKKADKNELYNIYNIANGKTVSLKKLLSIIYSQIKIKPKINFLKMQKGDVYKTHASIEKINKKINYKPKTSIYIGIKNYINWYKNYYLK